MQTRQTSSPALKTVAAQGSRDHFQEVLAEAAALAHRYLRTIGERRVGVTQEAIDRLPALGGTLPAQGQDARELNRVPVKLSPAKSAFRDDSHIPDVGSPTLPQLGNFRLRRDPNTIAIIFASPEGSGALLRAPRKAA